MRKKLRIKGNRETRLRGLPLGRYRITGKQFRIADALFSPQRPLNLKLTKKKPSKRVTFVFERRGGEQAGRPAIRFNLAGAIGILRTEAGTRGSDAATRSTTGSNLLALLPSGEVRAAIEGGDQTNPPQVEQFSFSPDGSVYLIFKMPGIELASTGPSDSSLGCTLVKVVPGSGSATCVDPEVRVVQYWASAFGFRFEPVQFDRRGSVYYLGSKDFGGQYRLVLRKKTPDGVITNLQPLSDSAISDFQVSAAGSVFISGSRLRVVTPQGSISDLVFPDGSPWGWLTAGGTRLFPDGRIFVYRLNMSEESVYSYNESEARLDPTPWIGPASISPQHDLEGFCSGFGVTAPDDFPRYCGTDRNVTGWAREKVALADGRVFDAHVDGGVVQVYPDLRGLPTRLDSVTAAEGVGSKIFLAGSVNGSRLVVAIDADTGAESVVLPAQEGIEIYNMEYSPSSGKLFFDGRRASDNSYVFGSVRPTGGELSVEKASTGRWEEFKVFG